MFVIVFVHSCVLYNRNGLGSAELFYSFGEGVYVSVLSRIVAFYNIQIAVNFAWIVLNLRK